MVFGTMLNIRETSMPTIETTMMGKCRQSCSYVNMAKPMYTKTKDSQPNAKTLKNFLEKASVDGWRLWLV